MATLDDLYYGLYSNRYQEKGVVYLVGEMEIRFREAYIQYIRETDCYEISGKIDIYDHFDSIVKSTVFVNIPKQQIRFFAQDDC